MEKLINLVALVVAACAVYVGTMVCGLVADSVEPTGFFATAVHYFFQLGEWSRMVALVVIATLAVGVALTPTKRRTARTKRITV